MDMHNYEFHKIIPLMQHAIMIMAHKNMEQLCHLVENFTHDLCLNVLLLKETHIC